MKVTIRHERRLSLTHRLVGLAAFAVLPAVTAPKAAGFGTRMIEATLGAQLGGDVRRCYPPEGGFVEVDAPARALLATAGGEASG